MKLFDPNVVNFFRWLSESDVKAVLVVHGQPGRLKIAIIKADGNMRLAGSDCQTWEEFLNDVDWTAKNPLPKGLTPVEQVQWIKEQSKK